MANRESITRAFLWLAVLVGGPLLGAKLFDLLVLVGAWGADPPASFAMMPYGKAWPVDTGVFFIPFSAAMLIAGFGALVAGWRTPWRYRWLLCLPSIGILLLLILTVAAFWPMNAALYYHGIRSPKDTITDAQSIAMAQRWVTLDWVRVGGGRCSLRRSVAGAYLTMASRSCPEGSASRTRHARPGTPGSGSVHCVVRVEPVTGNNQPINLRLSKRDC